MPETFDPSWEYYEPDPEIAWLIDNSSEISNDEMVPVLIGTTEDGSITPSFGIANNRGHRYIKDNGSLDPIHIQKGETVWNVCEKCNHQFSSKHVRTYCNQCSVRGRPRGHVKPRQPCVQCGNERSLYASICCSRECFFKYQSERYPEKICDVCNTPFKPAFTPQQLYCSHSCANIGSLQKTSIGCICKQCKLFFPSYRPNQQYCSYKCRGKAQSDYFAEKRKRELERQCVVCQIKFIPKRKNQYRCSNACKGKRRELPDVNCRYCAKTFRPINRNQRYCNFKCVEAQQNVIARERYWKGHQDVKNPCKRCGGEIIPNPRSKRKQVFCSFKCNKAFSARAWRQRQLAKRSETLN